MRRIEPYFPLSHGVPRVDDRWIVSGIIFVIRNGLRWRDAPVLELNRNGRLRPQAQASARGDDARQRRSEGSAVKKKVTPAAKREAVAHLQTTLGMSERRTCMVVGADRTSMRYRSCRDDADLRSRLRELAQQRRRFGYR